MNCDASNKGILLLYSALKSSELLIDLLLEPVWPVDLGTGVRKEEKENKEMESVPSGSPASSKCPTEFCHLELSEALLCHKNNPLFT